METDVQRIIEKLRLEPLQQEGGLFAQTYVSDDSDASGAPAATAIYYLLEGESFSHMHRLTGDEVYHFYLGDPVELLELLPNGESRLVTLGPDILNGQEVQHVVRAGSWQGSRLADGGSWALLGTTMHPGYSDEGYEHGCASQLISEYPEREREIRERANA